jgi:hypothetical protein
MFRIEKIRRKQEDFVFKKSTGIRMKCFEGKHSLVKYYIPRYIDTSRRYLETFDSLVKRTIA